VSARILLASSSPRRAEILAQLGVPFVVVPQVATELSADLTPTRLARENARRKARGALLVGVSPVVPPIRDVVIGVDTIVVLGSRVLGKPHDIRESKRMVEALSGRTHQVISAMHLEIPGRGGRAVTLAASTAVTFRRLSPREVRWYVSTEEGRDKAGAYGIQGYGAVLVERIHGDYFNVVGFPVRAFLRGLERLGIAFPDLARGGRAPATGPRLYS
jgi:septum formation protein